MGDVIFANINRADGWEVGSSLVAVDQCIACSLTAMNKSAYAIFLNQS